MDAARTMMAWFKSPYNFLLRGVRCRILMLDPLITKELIQGVVLELGAVVTSYCQDLCIVLTLSFICKVNDGLLGLTLPLEEIYPSVSLIIINIPHLTPLNKMV